MVIIDSWADLFGHEQPETLLQQWLNTLVPYYDKGSVLRIQTLEVRCHQAHAGRCLTLILFLLEVHLLTYNAIVCWAPPF